MSMTETIALRRLINGFQVSQAIHVAARLGIADLLHDRPLTANELATRTRSNESALYRLLRALSAAGLFHEDDGRRFSLTALGEGLRRDAVHSQAAWANFAAGPSLWKSWGHLLHSVKSGENAFLHAHGRNVWDHRAEHPEDGAIFDLAMRENSVLAAEAVLAACDFSRFRWIVDVGGGDGALLAQIARVHSGLRGTLLDQAHVVARAGDVFRTAGVTDRCEAVGGDFFEAVPEGADAYLLKSILHDWQDEEAIAILRACRNAMTADSTLIIVERLLAPPNQGADGKFSDLNMLINAGGQERTQANFAKLLTDAGLVLTDVAATQGHLHLLMALPGTGRQSHPDYVAELEAARLEPLR